MGAGCGGHRAGRLRACWRCSSLWFDAAGPAGDGIACLLRGAFGVGAVAFPVVGVYWGVVLLRDVAAEDRVRMFIGFMILVLGVLGLVSLFRGNPGVFEPYDVLAAAAGLIGAFAAHPLSRLVSPIGSGIVCAGAATLGLLIFTGTPVSRIIQAVQDFRDSRSERDPVAAKPEARGPSSPGRQGSQGLDPRGAGPRRRGRGRGRAPGVGRGGTDDEPEPAARPAKARTVSTASGPYQLPPLDLLRSAPVSTADGRDEKETMEALERTLQTFGVDARVTGCHRGPTVTMYEVEIAAGTKVNKVLQLSSDIAYALATPDVRIIAPIPGKSAIGVEVPNKHRDFVMLGDILRSKAAKDATHPLTVALGKDVHGRRPAGEPRDDAAPAHRGRDGSGKSSLINCFITSILMRTTPDDVRLCWSTPSASSSATSPRCRTCCRR